MDLENEVLDQSEDTETDVIDAAGTEGEAPSEAGLEQTVEANLKKLFAEDLEEETEEVEKVEGDATDDEKDAASEAEEPEKTEEADTEEVPEAEAKEDAEDDETKEAVDPAAPTLPDSYRRSLKAYGWQDSEIDSNLKLLGANFISTAAKIHSNRNEEVSRWAASGRAARESQQGGAEKKVAPVQPGRQDLQLLQPVDSTKLKEEYGEDTLVDAIVGPVNATVAAINSIIPYLQQGQEAVRQSESQALERQVNEFFGAASIKPYLSLYGDGKGELKPDQIDRRNKVLETADALMYGAKAQGRNLTVQEALTSAHDLISLDFKEEAVRTQIKTEVKKRNSGITQKPSSRHKATDSGRPRTMRELEGRVSRRLAEVFSE